MSLLASILASAARGDAPAGGGDRWLASWAFGCVAVVVVLLIADGYQGGFLTLNGAGGALPGWLWQWLTVLGDERVAFALALFFSRSHPRVFWSLVLAALAGIAYAHGLKPLLAMARPPAVLSPDSFTLIGPAHRKGSFPSGHSVTIGVLCAVWVFYLRSAWSRLLLIAVAVLVGTSRVAVGVHWPVDVAAGLFGGILAARAGVWVAQRTPWGVLDPVVHLAFVTLAAVLAGTLVYWDGGYGDAARMQALLGITALVYAADGYVLGPLLAGGRGRYWSVPGEGTAARI